MRKYLMYGSAVAVLLTGLLATNAAMAQKFECTCIPGTVPDTWICRCVPVG